MKLEINRRKTNKNNLYIAENDSVRKSQRRKKKKSLRSLIIMKSKITTANENTVK